MTPTSSMNRDVMKNNKTDIKRHASSDPFRGSLKEARIRVQSSGINNAKRISANTCKLY